MTPVTYRERAKFITVMRGREFLGRIVYRNAFGGWCWAPRNSTFRTKHKATWTEVKPDVEAWLRENEGKSWDISSD